MLDDAQLRARCLLTINALSGRLTASRVRLLGDPDIASGNYGYPGSTLVSDVSDIKLQVEGAIMDNFTFFVYDDP